MLFVWLFLIFGAVFIVVLVDFVLRNPMFAETFVVKIGVPFTQIEYVQENVDFIYIITGSLLLGALVIAISTWVLDAKRKFKVRGLRKELKNLQIAVEEAKASLPQQEVTQKDDESGEVGDAETPDGFPGSIIWSEEITKSFEDAVEGGDFLEHPSEEESAEEHVTDDQQANEEETHSEEHEAKQLPQDTAIEAEVVGSDEQVEEDEVASQEEAAERKKESDDA